MNRAGIFETAVGLIVMAVAALFLLYAYRVSDRDQERGGYRLSAAFGRVDGVTVGSEVRIAGVKVGSVAARSIDWRTYEARLELSLAAGVPVPEDSSAKIVSDGLLGGAFVSIEPGASEVMLKPGEAIAITQGSVDLIGLAMRAFTANAGGAREAAAEPAGEF